MSIIFIIVIVIIVIIVLILLRPIKHQNIPIDQYSKIKDKFKTGDIVFFSCKKHSSKLSAIQYFCWTRLLGTEYGHIGLVYRSSRGKLYVVECTDRKHAGEEYAKHLNRQRLGGVRIISMETLLNKYHCHYSGDFAVKFIDQAIPNDLFGDKLQHFHDKIFENKYSLVALWIIDNCFSHQIASNLVDVISAPNGLICSEFVHSMLFDCGVLKDYRSKIFWPHLADGKLFDQMQLVGYSALVKFKL